MWLINSPIGRKVVMSLTGICLILFLTFHLCMNLVAFFSGEGYNEVCAFLGSNWYAVLGTIGLAALAVIHRTAVLAVTTVTMLPYVLKAWSGLHRTCSCWV